jgi:radical SAM protein with 4Fe4S-binding SPASM domain
MLLSAGLASPPLPAPGSRHRSGLSCPGGTESITVLPDLRVAACGAINDEVMWSLREHSLEECWRHAPNLLAWRDLTPEEPCSSCDELATCSGGCRARARVVTGSLTGLDEWCCDSFRADRYEQEL